MDDSRWQSRTTAPPSPRHSDLSYLPHPATATLLYAIEVPEPVDGTTQVRPWGDGVDVQHTGPHLTLVALGPLCLSV